MKFRNPFKRLPVGKLIEAQDPKTPDDMAMGMFASVEFTAIAGADGKPDPAKPKSFSMVAYTGGLMKLAGWYYPVVVDLEGLAFSTPMTMLGNHLNDPDWVAGNADKIEIEGTNLNISGEVFPAGTTPMADKIAKLSAAGMKWQASIGAVADTIEFVEAGKKASANGQTFNGPMYIARTSTLRETSFVVIGADSDTSANVAASKTPENTGDSKMKSELKKWLIANGFDVDIVASNETQLVYLTGRWEASVAAEAAGGDGGTPPIEATPPAPAPNAGDDEIRARLDRMEHANQINVICGSGHDEIKANAIKDGTDVEVVRGLVANAVAAKNLEAGFPMPSINLGADGPNPASVMEASLCMTGGLSESDIGKSYGQKTMNAALTRDFRGFGLADLIFASLAAAGMSVRAGSITDDTIKAAFQADRRQIEGAFSTQSFTGILNNVANKKLLKAYAGVVSALDMIASTGSVPDFKQMESYSMCADGSFQPVGPDGELKNISLQDTQYTNQATTQGAIIALTRVMMINDDLGAFLRIPAILGRQAALAKERAGFTVLMDNGGSFFSSGNGNTASGAGTALQISALTSAVQQFMEQTDANGDPIMLLPDRLLVPPALKVTAEQLFNETRVNETTTANKPKPANNPHAGKYQPTVSPFLSNSSFNDNASDTGWYLFGNPADIAALEVVYLRGMQVPTIERGELDFNKLGAQFRGYFDFGVAFVDYRAANWQEGA
jgi:hypothetical protein